MLHSKDNRDKVVVQREKNPAAGMDICVLCIIP